MRMFVFESLGNPPKLYTQAVKAYDRARVYIDDEGLLKENPLPSMFDENGEPVLVGNLLICRNDPETGFEKELTNEDAQLIMRHVVGVSNPKDGRKWKGIHVGNFNPSPKGEIL